MQFIKPFHTVDAPAGSGKTYQAIRYALMQAAVHQRKSVLVFKSIDLLKQAQRDACTIDQQTKLSVPINGIHSHMFEQFGTDLSVGRLLLDHLNAAKHGVGEILMITEAAFINLPHWPNRWMWTCICDEIPSIAPADKLNIPDNHHMITGYIELDDDNEGYSQVLPTAQGKAVLAQYAENPRHDQVSAVLSSMARHIVSPYFETYVKTQQYERVKSGDGEVGARQIEMFSLLQPTLFGSGKPRQYQERPGVHHEALDQFADVILMGAGFQDSLLGLIWPHLDLQFEPFAEITNNLRYTEHDCGDRLWIEFLFEADWSKSFRSKSSRLDGVERQNLSIYLDAIGAEFEGAFLYLANKDIESGIKHPLESIKGIQLPNAPWGLNTYQHIHNVAILSALNPTPAHIGFLNHMGLEGLAIRDALYHSQIYQAVMRCSLRDPATQQMARVFVPDRKSAVALSEMFLGCHMGKLALDLDETQQQPTGRPKLPKTKPSAQTLRETRQRNRAIDKEIKRIQAGGAVDHTLVEKFQRECRADNKRLVQLLKLIV